MSDPNDDPKTYPITIYDEPGSAPDKPGNSRFIIGNTQITSGPSLDEDTEDTHFMSVQKGGAKMSWTYTPDDEGE